ncbi:MAG: BtrH N-terminal domain-containing protein [Bacteroidetes bacterium]|nr:BtrH N-terminal domain-containing protein [Bacteroidota bacterium]
MISVPYKHKMAAHCESGSITSLLNNAGLDITEPMVFGISSGLFFAYFHKMRSFTFPTFIVRNKPGQMRENFTKRTGVKFKTYSFSHPEKGFLVLDHLLDSNIPVAAQVDFYYMDYIPSWERVHINVHFIVVVGKDDSAYLVSDSYFPELVSLRVESLRKARFAGGNMSPKGFLFHPEFIPEEIDYETAIRKGIRKTCFNMLKIPIPFLGIKGIRMFAKKIVEWPALARDTEHLSHEVMKINVLLEDQGTGGAGFRFMFATFLQQAAAKINTPQLLDFSKKMMVIGDGWREFSLLAARFGKNRDLGPQRMKELSDLLMDRAKAEEQYFNELYKAIKEI